MAYGSNCKCGHPEIDHKSYSGACLIEDCDCRGFTPPEGDEVCSDASKCPQAESCPLSKPHKWSDARAVHEKFQRNGVCPSCIPYEPQPATCPDCGHPAHKVRCTELIPLERYNNDRDLYDYRACGCTPADLQPEYECTRNHKCVHEPGNTNTCTGSDWRWGRCSFWQPKKPDTCPECGHPAHKVRCTELIPLERYNNDRDLYDYRACGCTPADLQSKHCTGCLNPSDNYNCVSKEDCPEQPTPTMPLREQFAEILYGDKEVATAYEVYPLFTKTLNQLMKKVEAHDSAIRREFAEKVIQGLEDRDTLPIPTDYKSQLPLAAYYQGEQDTIFTVTKHIRAMAEGKE